MKYFVKNKIRKERLKICKGCEHYFKLTGNCSICKCFMRVKTSLSFSECAIGLWGKTEEIQAPKELPKHLVKEVQEIWKLIKNKQVKDHETKARMIELYNTIYETNHKTTTNCGSCLASIYRGLNKYVK